MTAAPDRRPGPPPQPRPRYRLPAWQVPYPGRSNRPQRWGGISSGWSPAWSWPEPALANVQLMTTPGQLFSKCIKQEPFQARVYASSWNPPSSGRHSGRLPRPAQRPGGPALRRSGRSAAGDAALDPAPGRPPCWNRATSACSAPPAELGFDDVATFTGVRLSNTNSCLSRVFSPRGLPNGQGEMEALTRAVLRGRQRRERVSLGKAHSEAVRGIERKEGAAYRSGLEGSEDAGGGEDGRAGAHCITIILLSIGTRSRG